MPNESPETIVPSLIEKYEGLRHRINKENTTNPRTPTVHTRVRSPRILPTPIRSITLPDATSHFRKLVSEPPVTSHESNHSSSSSSLSLPLSSSPARTEEEVLPEGRGTGGPHAMLRTLHFTLSNRREWVNVSFATERIRTVPSSQPSAREVHEGFAAMDQIEPPWEGMVL